VLLQDKVIRSSMEALMARKKLSDLVREEANKPKETESEQATSAQSPPDSAATSQSDTAKTSASKPSTSKPSAPKSTSQSQPKANPQPSVSETVDVKAEPVEAEDSRLLAAQSKVQDLGKVQDLETTIATLQSDLQAAQDTAHQTESKLKQTIKDLQAELDQKQETIDQLQTDSKQMSQLKSELEDAKKMILQLSQVNAQPAPPRPTPALNRAAEPELESSSTAIKPASAPDRGFPPKQNQIALRQILDHPTRPGKLPAMSSDKISEKAEDTDKIDIGWMD
jgi:myosin heavy subunit